MRQYKTGSKLYLIVGFALFIGGAAQAETVADLPLTIDDYKALKVVGRGILNRDSQATLQLACVGKRIQPDSLERNCNVLSFLLTEASGSQRLVGWPFFVFADSKQTIRRQLRDDMRMRGIRTTPSEDDVMGTTRSLFTSGKRSDDRRLFALTISSIAIFGGPWFLLAGPGAIMAVDILLLPVTITSSLKRENQVLNVKSAEALRERAMDQWQVRPKKVRAKRFNRVLELLNEENATGFILKE